ncbi:MAG: metal ABC transporter substrate-binding protein, partial [Acidimicrobiia bacterium]
MRAPRIRILLLVATLYSGVVSCAQRSPQEREQLQVVASVSPITSLVEAIGRTNIDLVGIVPEGVNSHTFEPAPSDARLLASADIVFINGLALEEPIKKLARANLNEGAQLVELGDRAIAEHEWIFDFSFPKERGDPNPHLWTNPPYVERFVRIITEELAEADPANAARYNTNLRGVTESLQKLDQATREASNTVNPD